MHAVVPTIVEPWRERVASCKTLYEVSQPRTT